MPCCLPYGKAGELQILRCHGIAVDYYGFTLDALTLNPSGFCNVGDKTVLRFSENDGNRQSGETGQLAKPAQPLSFSLLWHSRLSLTRPTAPGFLE
jgi:hypothetical protein